VDLEHLPIWTSSKKIVIRTQPVEIKKVMRVFDNKSKKPRCCLCSKIMSPGAVVIEERPTAEDGSMQKWYYCSSCWVELRKLREPVKGRKRFIAISDSSANVELDED
jgi:hypothetical protein